jgi:hypothetical protein
VQHIEIEILEQGRTGTRVIGADKGAGTWGGLAEGAIHRMAQKRRITLR